MSKTMENVIAVIIMVAVLIGLLLGVGYESIKDWLSKPFIWEELGDVTIRLFSKNEISEEDITLQFLLENRAGDTIEEFEFLAYIEGVEIEIDSEFLYNTIDPYDKKIEEVTITKDNHPSFSDVPVDEVTYDKIKNTKLEDLQVTYRTVYLRGEEDILINNNGTGKIITILVASLVLGLLSFVKRFPAWLRIVLKVCSLPIAVGVIILILMGIGANSSSADERSKESQYNSAKQRYDRAANQKAGAIKTGNRHSAAKAQEEMDRAMADMIVANKTGSSSSIAAAAKYKREANLKAGASITGRAADAARAQANMDKALADMVRKE